MKIKESIGFVLVLNVEDGNTEVWTYTKYQLDCEDKYIGVGFYDDSDKAFAEQKDFNGIGVM